MAAAVALPVALAPQAVAAGTVTEYSAGISPLAGVSAMTAGPDGNLWFTEISIDRIGRVTPTGTVTEFSTGITANANPWDITAGPDNNLWFTETGRDPEKTAKIGRITPAGVVTEFTSGLTPQSRPEGITAGPDGNLWFTEFAADKIGRITPAGVITEFAVGITEQAEIVDITAGPDGNLWFTENFANKVGRITPAGVVTEFPIPTVASFPMGIISGPDGNLWFTETAGKVARITPSGTITEFPIPTVNSVPWEIVSGPDGNLWFTEYFGQKLGRITTGGVITEFSNGITTPAFPKGIASGPDGNIWFTEIGGNRVAKITTGPDTPGTTSRYFPLPPKRLLDSRDGTGGFSSPWGAGQSRNLTVTAGSTTVPANATAVVLNVTGVNASAQTHVTVWPAGETMPEASNLNLPPQSVRPNLVVVKVGAAGQVSLFNNAGTVDLLADVVGYFAPDNSGSLYNGLTPHRILDTRDGTGGFNTPWGAGQSRDVSVSGGITTVPPGATAVSLNVTVTGPTTASHLTVWPAGDTQPVASNVNFSSGESVANAAIVKVGAGGKVSVFNNAGTTQVIVDVVGYYTSSGGVYTPVSPKRLLDSRDGTGGYSTPWVAAQTRQLTVSSGTTTIPAGATAVVVNLTGVNPSSATHIGTWPAGIPMPVASNLNLPAHDIRANLAIVKIGGANQISIFNNAGNIDLVADVVGYYE